MNIHKMIIFIAIMLDKVGQTASERFWCVGAHEHDWWKSEIFG
jgi:hypothetical protein